MTFQIWLSIVNTTQYFHYKLFSLHASGGQEINTANSLNLPFCEMWVTNKELTGYTGNNVNARTLGCVLISQGKVIDWSPYGFPQEKYSHSELRWQRHSLNGTREIRSTVDEPTQ